MKKTIQEIVDEREIDRPKILVYILLYICSRIYSLINKVKFIYNFDKNSMKHKQVLLLADHASLLSAICVFAGYPFTMLNVVSAYHIVMTKFLFWIAIKVGIILTRNFQNELRPVWEMLKIIKKNGSLFICPEGFESITGTALHISKQVAFLIKECNVAVVTCKSFGFYMGEPFFSKYKRKGYRELQYDILFTKEQVQNLSEDEIYKRIVHKLYFDDCVWNDIAKHEYFCKYGLAEGLEKLLFVCPKCGKEFTLKTESDIIYCTHCGNKVKLNKYYSFEKVNENTILPYKHIDDWYKAQKEIVCKQLDGNNFSMKYECDLIALNNTRLSHNRYYVNGEGTVYIDNKNLTYIGLQAGKEVKLVFSIVNISFFSRKKETFYHKELASQGNCMYYDKVFYCFSPKTEKEKIEKIRIIVEELNKRISSKRGD